jgi:hypothetical protein
VAAAGFQPALAAFKPALAVFKPALAGCENPRLLDKPPRKAAAAMIGCPT